MGHYVTRNDIPGVEWYVGKVKVGGVRGGAYRDAR